MPAIRVLVVDDSLVFRKQLQQSLSQDPMIDVISTAIDPLDAKRKILSLHPDVVTLDVEMPHMNGIDFLKQLIPQYPVPVVVVTSTPTSALNALSSGAVDFVKKPVIKSPEDLQKFMRDLRFKVKIASHAKVKKFNAAAVVPSLTQRISAVKALNQNTLIAIGASTGGTEAILAVVKNLPKNTPGIVIVQHMPPVFTNMYAQRLDKICKMTVKEASDNDRIEQGRILIAAGEHHMRVLKDSRGYYIRSQPGERVNGHCPAVDVLFNSIADLHTSNAIGVILTGMGADGAKGLLRMRQAGAFTIGQNEASCVVYGMPMEAYKMGAVCKQLSLDQIPDEILYQLNKH
ncbi:MAG TPA: chemotaxis response regulator protein-glutamate methylesterase [Ruminococcaceae bacterium]|jgi:two-component system chemotaxis response regulator CheB|nr:chemotaxis response regulator protein-glutamate methylesterase [Oscillospiraceae bacterium]HCM24056.1 chemotaxis response regulator protein-glutamate methylesterase [Oscillospiraceae bacterium]